MGSVAGLFKQAGYDVTGSDSGSYPPMNERLAEMGISFHPSYSLSNLDPKPDLLIVGNACTPKHEEASFARDNNFVQLSFPEAIAEYFIGKGESIVVAGTHGKTTTTGLAVHTFKVAGKDPGFLIGGVLKSENTSYDTGKGEYFIIEGDEYDCAYFDKRPKFAHYRPSTGIVTSMEHDHIDIYPTFEEYKESFEYFAKLVRQDGVLILNGEFSDVRDLAQRASCKVLTYGFTEDEDIYASSIDYRPDGTHFVLKHGELKTDMVLSLPGKHNLSNALSVAAAALHHGINFETIREAFSSFEGLKRRQEVIGDVNGVLVLDDFAHHPTAVRETIFAVSKKYPGRRIVAVFQPRSNSSRRKLFEKEYGEAFDHADLAIICSPPLRHNDNPDDFMDIGTVVTTIVSRGSNATSLETADLVLKKLKGDLRKGDLVLIMSNGGFDGIHVKLLDQLAE